MNDVTNSVLRLGKNTELQAQELSRRAVVVLHGRDNTFVAFSILDADASNEQAQELRRAGFAVSVNALLAPNGLYQPVATEQQNVIAIHRRVKDGRLRVYGPFTGHPDAYDHFDEDESPHDTVVTVVDVFADMRSLEERRPAF